MITFMVTVVAYALGSIPFGYLIVRAKMGSDVRQTGSGGTGATNVSRRAGKTAGLVTLLLDAAKGAAAVLIARALAPSDSGMSWAVALAAVTVIVGHIFPVWLRFRGGKGVATAIGVFVVLAPLAVVLAGVLFLIVFELTRYVSLASIFAAVTVPILIWLRIQFGDDPSGNLLLVTATAVSALIIFAHRANIARLLRGAETKFR